MTLTADLTVTIGGGFSVGNNVTINANGHLFRINAGGNVAIGNNGNLQLTISSGGDVSIGNNTHLTGDVTAGGDLSIKNNATVNGSCTPSHPRCTGDGGSGPPPVINAGGFNCVVSGADAVSGHLYLQKVGTSFTFDVVAVKDSNSDGIMDAQETAYASDADRSVTVQLVDASGAVACGARPALSPGVSQTLLFSAADNGRKAAAAMVVGKALRTVGCRVTDTAPDPDLVGCSTDTFTIRPTALSLSPPALNNSASAGAPSAAAGSAFSLAAVGGAGYTGVPKIDNSKLIAHAGAVRAGMLAGPFSAADAASGTATGSDFSYSEVGSFRLAAQGLYDDSFASSDAADGDCSDDFSQLSVGGRYGCKFANTADTAWVGRFHPATLTVSTISDGALGDTCPAGGFSYQGQEVTLTSSARFRVTAYNSSGAITHNYSGAYAKLGVADFFFAAVAADSTQLGVDGVTPVALAWTNAGNRTLTDNADGTLDLVVSAAGFTWGRGANDLVAPFVTDLEIGLSSVVDGDGLVAAGTPLAAKPDGVEMHYGRIALANAHGSELQNLAMPMQVEHYAGSAIGFVRNTADSCSSVSVMAFTDLNGTDGLLPAEVCIWDTDNDSGLGCAGNVPPGMEFESPPLAGLFNLNLKAPGSGNSGVIGVTAVVPTHLKYDWSSSGDIDPTGRATFGIFNRPSSIVFRRELR
ncbi:MAG: hypothetical protein LJE59_13575 [Chromatiaceae bacterium]|nr:hypothetical protein [Chromatiaceae bacterium]